MSSPVKDAYLVVYNLACAGGWSFVLLACISHILAGSEPQALYDEVEMVLQVVQTAALMEVRACLSATTGVLLITCATLYSQLRRPPSRRILQPICVSCPLLLLCTEYVL